MATAVARGGAEHAAVATSAAADGGGAESREPDESDTLVESPPTAPAAAPAAPAPGVAGANETASPPPPKNRAALAIMFWLAMSCTQILFNKALFSGPFRYPITLTSIHMGFASVATWALRGAGVISAPPLPGGWAFYLRHFVALSVLFTTALACGNVAASRLSVSFVHVLKAITPVVTLLVGIVAGVNKVCVKLMAIVAVISVGVVIASADELAWDTLGFALQLAAVLAESVRLVTMQLLLQKHLPKTSPLVMLSLFAPLVAVALVALSLWAEPGGDRALWLPSVGPLVALNTASSFALNVAVMVLVSTTSGLTLVLAGIVKDIIVIVASLFLFAGVMSPVQSVGYFLALFGLALYDAYKQTGEGKEPLGAIVRVAVLSPRMLAICVAVPCVALVSNWLGTARAPGGQ
jgi:hypothetical protein